MQQIHSANYAWVDSTHTEQPVQAVDALLTKEPHLALLVRTADCLPVTIWHSSGLLALIHAGRRSTQQSICLKVAEELAKSVKQPGTWHVFFGPAISGDCYQIDREKDTYFDLKKENTRQIMSVLGPSCEFEIEDECTHCLPDKYHSYRRDGAGVTMNYTAAWFASPRSPLQPQVTGRKDGGRL